MSVVNPITGSGVIGWSFNIFGRFTADEKRAQLLDLSKNGTYQQEVGGETVSIPDNAAYTHIGEVDTESQYCDSIESVSNFFQTEASVEGSYGGFSGEINAAYSKEERSNAENCFFILRSVISAFELTIKASSIAYLHQDVLSDPDYQNMIAVAGGDYSLDVAAKIWTFFNKYGTHFCHELRTGGALTYSSCLQKSSTFSSEDITLSATAEYNGLFTSVKGSAKAEWKKVKSNYSEHRSMRSIVLGGDGGDAAKLAVIDVERDTNVNDFYTPWVDSCYSKPIVSSFKLTGIWELFSGQVADNIEHAYAEFANTSFYGTMSINENKGFVGKTALDLSNLKLNAECMGESDTLESLYDDPIYMYSAFVVDRKTLVTVKEVNVSGPGGSSYYADPDSNKQNQTIPSELEPYKSNSDYLIIFYWLGVLDNYSWPGTGTDSDDTTGLFAPDGELRKFMIDCGATLTEGIDWKTKHGNIDDILNGEYSPYNNMYYVMIGIPNSSHGSAYEKNFIDDDISIQDPASAPKMKYRSVMAPDENGLWKPEPWRNLD